MTSCDRISSQDKSRSRSLASNHYSFHKPDGLHNEQHASSHLHSHPHHRTAKTSQTSFNQMQQLRQSLSFTEAAGKPYECKPKALRSTRSLLSSQLGQSLRQVLPHQVSYVDLLASQGFRQRQGVPHPSKNEALVRSSGSRA